MKIRFAQHLTSLCVLASAASFSSFTNAASFQIWEQDGASVGNYHAGYAALANDASTAFYNPAGITRIKNQQVVVGLDGIRTSFKYKGSVTTNLLGQMNNVSVNGGVFAAVPSLHYVAPINEQVGFGFSVDVPFGLKTNYGGRTEMRYAATMSSLNVVDVSPSLAYQLNNQWSFGAGLDYQRVFAELDSVVGADLMADPAAVDTDSRNKADGSGYGYHLGGLYQFSPDTRVGLSYHSQVKHHLTGNSKFTGPLAEFYTGGNPIILSKNAYVNVTLPAYTALSGYHKFHPQFAVMGSAIYTQWNVMDVLTLNNIAGVDNHGNPSTSIAVALPMHYRNSWNLSLGADYYLNPAITLRGGLGYDQTPLRDQYRDVRIPDNDRYIVAVGGHYQATKTIGFDLGWSHFFVSETNVNPPPLAVGAENIRTNGKVDGSADVVGLQVTWDIV